MKIKTNLKSIVIASAMTGSLLFASASSVLAQNASPSATHRGAAVCSAIAGRIATAITNSQAHQAKVAGVITKYDDFLKNHTASFQTKYGMDAYNTLAADFKTLHDTYGTQITNDWNTFTADLTNIKAMSDAGNCATTNGLFATQRRQTKSDRAKVRSDIRAYRDYVNNTIRFYLSSLTPLPTALPTPTPASTPASAPTPSADTSTPTAAPTSDQAAAPALNNNICTDQKPGSAPVLLSAVANDQNQVTLTWSKAADPVTYYLIAYGTKSGIMEYGNPNVGDQNTTAYTAGSLSGSTKYYFRVRAGNNCMPGDFSNELSATANGLTIQTPATGFLPGVLSANQNPQDNQNSGSISDTQKQSGHKINSLIDSIKSFIQSTWDNISRFFKSIIPVSVFKH